MNVLGENMSNIEEIKNFVVIGYRNFLKREPDPGELELHASLIVSGRLARAEFLVTLIKSEEYKILTDKIKSSSKKEDLNYRKEKKYNITLIIASRKRPLILQGMFDSAINTAKYPDLIEMSIYVDNDDFETQEHLKTMKGNVQVTIGERILLSEMNNKAYEKATADILMFGSDDLYLRSKDWDDKVMDIFNRHGDKIIFVHGYDSYFRGGFGIGGFLHRRWVETVGYFYPPYFSALHSDRWINDVANALGRRIFLPDVITEHVHPGNNKEYTDRAKRDDVDQLYLLLEDKRQIDIQKLRNIIKS